MFTEVIYFMTDVQFNNNYDVFHSFLVEKADYDGYFEFPKIARQSYNIFKSNGKDMERFWLLGYVLWAWCEIWTLMA